ncbi:MAG: MgtC/SapB family protein [Firmicutes bacterium]|jgi:putative Mg2+ transporter-C (MgtC) family protein|nr:MgtC/SapB family protein [Bacillota bacterium]
MHLLLKDTALLGLATLLGAVIGFERERQGKSAGLRTHALVCLGATLITLASIRGFGEFGSLTRDPARVAAQIVSGIGFLGAGTIMREGATIKGLTTAASLWTTAGIGLAIGSGLAWLALAATVFVELTLIAMSKFEKRYVSTRHASMKVVAVDRTGLLGEIATILGSCGLNIIGTEIDLEKDGSIVSIEFSLLRTPSTRPGSETLQHILGVAGVLRAETNNW